MILFLILIIVVILAAVMIRRQMYFQHRDMMRSIDPERMAKEDAIERAKVQKLYFAYGSILAVFAFLCLLALSSQCQFRGFGPSYSTATPAKIENNK